MCVAYAHRKDFELIVRWLGRPDSGLCHRLVVGSQWAILHQAVCIALTV